MNHKALSKLFPKLVLFIVVGCFVLSGNSFAKDHDQDSGSKHGQKRCMDRKGHWGCNAKSYVGDKKNGVPHGNGKFTWSDGSWYEGEVMDGEKHGQGKLVQEGNSNDGYPCTYKGSFKEGKVHGKVNASCKSGWKYIGDAVEDVFQGYGLATWPDGHRYVGQYVNGKRHGQGTFTFPDGVKTVGIFKDDQPWNAKEFNSDGSLGFVWKNGKVDPAALQVELDRLAIGKKNKSSDSKENKNNLYGSVEINRKKLLATKACPGCDLTGGLFAHLNLSGANLSNADLTGANLLKVNLARADLSNTNLSNAKLKGVDLTGANLSNANLSKANLRRSKLTGVNFSNANLSNSILAWADLTRADLTGADLTGADLFGAKLIESNLTKANMTGGDLRQSDLTRANLTGANLTHANLKDTKFVKAVLTDMEVDDVAITSSEFLRKRKEAAEAKRLAAEKAAEAKRLAAQKKLKNPEILLATMKCPQCDLTGVDFSNIDLSGAVLSGANLSGAILKGTNLHSANLKSAVLTNANLTGADLTSASLKWATLLGANLNGVNLTDANLHSARLDGTKYSGITLTGSNLELASSAPKPLRILWAKERLKDAVGYKDIKIGLTRSELGDLGVCRSRTEMDLLFAVLFGNFSEVSSVECYDKRDWKFAFDYSINGLETISINLGVLSSEYYSEMYGLLSKRYHLDYGVTERDVDLFNNGDKMFLYEVFEGGQVSLGQRLGCAQRNSNYENNCARMEVYLFIEYRDKNRAGQLVNVTQPQKDKASDF